VEDRHLQTKWLGAGLAIAVLAAYGVPAAEPQSPPASGWKKLSGTAAKVIEQGGTERRFSGRFLTHSATGTYTCARCAAPLFPSSAKFKSGTGWPSFDQALPGAIKEVRDADGDRFEIRCSRCDGHLGHVFRGEAFTAKKTRHCVNSAALGFAADTRKEAFFAGGCFWGVEHLLEQIPGVLNVESGYMGGSLQSPSYRQVVGGQSGHVESVRVTFNPSVVTYRTLAKSFFEIHDPTQPDGQGPDIGPQYRSAVFVTDSSQEKTIHDLIGLLRAKGLSVVTKVEPAEVFWPAEAYHQDYYARSGKAPYCHARIPRFD
jgi:peptide methionine sulfoxide reductase msrA/msrB